MSSKSPLHILIVGAGTGGLTLAQGLKRAGIRVSVFERDRTPRDARGGYRVGISPAGSRAMKTCLPPEIFELFVATCARAPKYFIMMTERFSEVLCLEMTGEAADPIDGEKNVNRMTMRNVLLAGLEDSVVFDKKFERYVSGDNGTVTAYFEDGTHATGDVLIGADGAGSRLRKQRLPQLQHEETGIVSLGGKLPLNAESKALLNDKQFHGMSMIMAPHGMGGIIHALEFAWNRNSGEKVRDLIVKWPTLQNESTDDYIGWALWGARDKFPKGVESFSGGDLIRLGAEMTRDWHPNMRKLIEMTDPATALFLNMRTSVPVPPWDSSNVTLLGDAVHTMTPGKGAGANTALRDAALLCQTFVAVQAGKTPLLEAIHAYEVEMLRYSSQAVLESRKQMNSNDLIHKPWIGGVQLGIMRMMMRLINVLPPIKRQIMRSVLRVRGAN